MISKPAAIQVKIVNLVSQPSIPNSAGGKNSPTVGGNSLASRPAPGELTASLSSGTHAADHEVHAARHSDHDADGRGDATCVEPPIDQPTDEAPHRHPADEVR